MTMRNLDFLFHPRSIAVIGASSDPLSIGGAVMLNLLRGGFSGPIFPLNPQGRPVAGVHVYPDVSALPQAPDLALVCTVPDEWQQLVQALAARGNRAMAVLTGAPPRDADGQSLRKCMLEASRPHLLRILGPNSMGLIIPRLRLNAGFFPVSARRGHIAFVSQSGSVTAAALDWAAPRDIGFSHVISLGDAIDVDAGDILDYLGGNPDVHALLLYIESIRNARKFLSAARFASRNKPVLVFKAGRTAEGAQAALRHAACDPCDDEVFEAAIRRAGMIRVATLAELFAAAETLSRGPHVSGERLYIVTNARGPAVIATDALVSGGGELARLPASLMERLRPLLPEGLMPANPLDLGANATPAGYAGALRSVLDEPADDAVLIMHAPSAVAASRKIAAACAAVLRQSGRAAFACWMGSDSARRSSRKLQEAGVAVHDTPEAAVHAFLHALDYRRSQESLQQAPSSIPPDFTPDVEAVDEVLRQAEAQQRERLSDPEGKAMLAAYGIATTATHAATSVDEAAAFAQQIGYPVALKVLSPDLEHRSEVGGVMLNLESEDELRRAAYAISRRLQALRPDARLAGFSVQRMIRLPGTVHLSHRGHELLVHAREDPVFGPAIWLRPASAAHGCVSAIGLVPLNGALARDMVTCGHLPAALGGTRHRPGADLGAIVIVLTRLSQLLVERPEVVEVEIDPLFCDDQAATVVEVRVRLAWGARMRRKRLAIRPYPKELEQWVESGGHRILLRPIKPEDATLYSQFIGQTEDPDLRYRFFSVDRHLSARDLARYTQIDYDRDMVFVAVVHSDEAGEEILGETRALRYPDGATAEFTLLVRSDMKRRGLGSALLEKLIAYCRDSGVREIIGQILPWNDGMIELAKKYGMTVTRHPEAGIAVAHLDLTGTGARGSPGETIPEG